jgi:fluoroacetyl-CoA thioesterase
MKIIFKPGDKKVYKKAVADTDVAAFHGEVLHTVCSTFSLARDFEWSSRLFFIDMKEEDEEGVGTFLSIDHKSPAFVGEEIIFTATVVKIVENELTCMIEARTGNRLIATGTTGQKMLKNEKLKKIFTKPLDQ